MSGPAGYFIELAKPFERSAFPMSADNIQSLGKGVVSADGKERVRQLHQLGTLAIALNSQTDAVSRTRLAEIRDILLKAREQADPVVRAWAMYNFALVAPEDERTSAVQRLLATEDSWHSQLLGLVAMEVTGLPPERRKEMATRVAARRNIPKFVSSYANAALNLGNTGVIGPQTRPGTSDAPGKRP